MVDPKYPYMSQYCINSKILIVINPNQFINYTFLNCSYKAEVLL